MIKFAHLIYIPMTGVGINNGYKSDEWFENRIEIFKEYTLKSLCNQTQKVFMLWLSFRPEEKNNPLVEELGRYLAKVNMPTIMTFDGLMYWDDKFSKGLKNRLMNMARVTRGCFREKNFKQLIPSLVGLLKDKNKTLLKRLDNALFQLRDLNEFLDVNYIYVTRIDSDDMFHKEAIAEIQRIKPFEGALVYENGFVYNSNTKEMAEWKPETNPPFHTIIFLGSIFFNPIEHLRYYGSFRSHEDIPRVFPIRKMKDGRYCVVVHGNHISTVWNHRFRGKPVDSKLLNDFK